MHHMYMRLLIGFVGALILSILPMPEFISAFRPPWILLLILYIEYYVPDNFRVSTLFLVGFLLDVLLSTVLGEHAFALLLVTWIASGKSRRFQFFSMTQQMCIIGIFCLFYQSVLLLIHALLGFHYNIFVPPISALFGIFFWPWIRILGDSSLATRIYP